MCVCVTPCTEGSNATIFFSNYSTKQGTTAAAFLSRIATLSYTRRHVLGSMARPKGQSFKGATDRQVARVAELIELAKIVSRDVKRMEADREQDGLITTALRARQLLSQSSDELNVNNEDFSSEDVSALFEILQVSNVSD